ncbi:hypothetical protein HYR54_07260 [Candidatus Acetothermia bacterium]|nr:hypothetical protein [Candidatus Acetothermia bacterium]
MADFKKPWFVAGGWAIDLYLGRVTRVHKDIEISILRSDQLALQKYLKTWELKKVIPKTGGRMELWVEREFLELPIHEIHGYRANDDPSHLEILLNESSGEHWKFRRNPAITRPVSQLGLRSGIGVPILSPEIVLLYKAKEPRLDDEVDFQNVFAALDDERRVWLRQAIEVCYPGHE